MRYQDFVYVCLMLLLSLIMGCVPASNQEPSSAQPSEDIEELELSYTVIQSQEPVTRQGGSPFELSADNCSRLADARLDISQTQEFRVYLELDVPRNVSTQLGGEEVAEEKLRAEVQQVLDLPLGAIRRVEANHQITVPPDSRSVAELQWQQIWTAGTISVQGADGRHLGEVPYAVLDTLRLVDLGEEASRCPATAPDPTQVPPSATATPSPMSGTMPGPKSVEYDGSGFVWVWASQDAVRDEDWYFDIKFYHNFFSELPYDIIVAEPAKTERAGARWRFVFPGTIEPQCGSFWTVQIARRTPDDTFAGFLSPESERLPTKHDCGHDPDHGDDLDSAGHTYDPDEDIWIPPGGP